MAQQMQNYNKELVVVTDKLDKAALHSIIDENSKILAIWVQGYIERHVCDYIAKNLSNKAFAKYSFYADDIPVGRLGMAFGETCLDEKLQDEYFGKASETRTLIREIADPYISPVDKLMIDLDTLWDKGAITPEMYGKRMLSGIYRSIMPGGKITQHQDNLKEELPNADFIPVKDLVSNVFIEIPDDPESGGEFQVWDYSPKYHNSLSEYYNDSLSKDDHHLSDDDFKNLENQECITIKPQVGDLIIFNPMNIHQVTELKLGRRISSSFHIGYMGVNKQLYCWS